jgi:hypothetical protein
MAIADWTRRLRSLLGEIAPKRTWPLSLRNIWLATLFFIGLTWLELGYGVTDRPWLTAMLALFMLACAIVTIHLFEKKAFCRYACLVGRVSGLYAMFAATELRAQHPAICRQCSTKDCYRGNHKTDPCPTGQFLGAMRSNTYCTLCTECLKSCPKDNVAFNVRWPGVDLFDIRHPRTDEAYLAVILLSMSAFHGLTMTPVWTRITSTLSQLAHVGDLSSFTVGMLIILLLPMGLFYSVCLLMKGLAPEGSPVTTRVLFVRFAYSLLPIALFYHLAHNVQHIVFEGEKFLRVASDPFGWGWNLFGTASLSVDLWIPVTIAWGLQITLILVGHIYGILIAHRTATELFGRGRSALLSQVPMLVAMVLFSYQSMWLISMPMSMRTAM